MKTLSIIMVFLFVSLSAKAQVDPGLLLGLTRASTPEISTLTGAAEGSLLYNSTEKRLYLFDGSSWVPAGINGTDDQTLAEVLTMGNDAQNNRIRNLANPSDPQDASTKGYVDNLPYVYTGAFRITRTGSQVISGIPFEPSSISFTAHANVEDFNINDDNGIRNNERGIDNSFGSMNGFARNDGGSISHQVIYVGGHGNSINDISRYASNTHCIGIRYGNQNGDNLGTTTARVTSFSADGFAIQTDNYADGLLVLYTAYR